MHDFTVPDWEMDTFIRGVLAASSTTIDGILSDACPLLTEGNRDELAGEYGTALTEEIEELFSKVRKEVEELAQQATYCRDELRDEIAELKQELSRYEE